MQEKTFASPGKLVLKQEPWEISHMTIRNPQEGSPDNEMKKFLEFLYLGMIMFGPTPSYGLGGLLVEKVTSDDVSTRYRIFKITWERSEE